VRDKSFNKEEHMHHKLSHADEIKGGKDSHHKEKKKSHGKKGSRKK
jgi:hypothetical protein